MSEYIGIDLHKAKSFVTRLDAQGRVLEQVNLPHASGELERYLTRLPADTRIAVEATGNWMWLYELIEARHPDARRSSVASTTGSRRSMAPIPDAWPSHGPC